MISDNNVIQISSSPLCNRTVPEISMLNFDNTVFRLNLHDSFLSQLSSILALTVLAGRTLTTTCVVNCNGHLMLQGASGNGSTAVETVPRLIDFAEPVTRTV